MRAELVKVIPNCRPSGTPPFSLSQDVLVPFLGIRWAPHHEALQDTLDEAITITPLFCAGLSTLMRLLRGRP